MLTEDSAFPTICPQVPVSESECENVELMSFKEKMRLFANRIGEDVPKERLKASLLSSLHLLPRPATPSPVTPKARTGRHDDYIAASRSGAPSAWHKQRDIFNCIYSSVSLPLQIAQSTTERLLSPQASFFPFYPIGRSRTLRLRHFRTHEHGLGCPDEVV
ncbi:unnamed protein product [Protopolystoma xenopodis]|uniref:Uncharacterized protein n=1 Tax=Protopolystoma xenopodis TaxID=117903 RepID=A0A448WQ24_9PLAT|nr:unnamed protein product [Protopolystoma xenopodis]